MAEESEASETDNTTCCATVAAYIISTIIAFMILTIQLAMSVWICIGGLLVRLRQIAFAKIFVPNFHASTQFTHGFFQLCGVTAAAMHFMNRSVKGAEAGVDGPDRFFGPHAARFLRICLLFTAYLNVLWALRGFASPRVITTGLYGVPVRSWKLDASLTK